MTENLEAKISVRLISFIGIRDKFFKKYKAENLIFREGIELSNLVGGIEIFDRCDWIENIRVPDSFEDALIHIKKTNFKYSIIYLGRKKVSFLTLRRLLKEVKKGSDKIIIINEKKFDRDSSLIGTLKTFIKDLIVKIFLVARIQISKNNLVDYFITNSYSANYKTIFSFSPKKVYKCSFLDCQSYKVKPLKNNGLRFGLYLDSYLPYTDHVVTKWGKKINANKYYAEIVKFLKEEKIRRNLDQIFIYCHPNSFGKEQTFFSDFEILDRNDYELSDIDFCQVIWGAGSDALISFVSKGYDSTVLASSSQLPSNLVNYHKNKANILGIKYIDTSTRINTINSENFFQKLLTKLRVKIFLNQIKCLELKDSTEIIRGIIGEKNDR